MEVTVYDSISAGPIYGDAPPHGSTLATVILVYSDDQSVRAAVRAARLYIREKRKIDLFILDGEAVPEGGLGLAHALKDELIDCPPIMVIIQRPQDSWLARWSGAEAVISHPIDPFTLGQKVAEILA